MASQTKLNAGSESGIAWRGSGLSTRIFSERSQTCLSPTRAMLSRERSCRGDLSSAATSFSTLVVSRPRRTNSSANFDQARK